VGRPPAGHRRSRSIESGGSGALAEPGDAFRAELERIGSAAALQRRSSASGEPAGAPAAAASAARGPESAKEEKVAPQLGAKDVGGQEEAALISWDELDAQRDVYRAVATADGRHALVRSPSGARPVHGRLLSVGFFKDPSRHVSRLTCFTELYGGSEAAEAPCSIVPPGPFALARLARVPGHLPEGSAESGA
jgi:hypothetical protein